MIDYRTAGDKNSFEEKINIIMSDGKSRHDAEWYLKELSVIIYDQDDFEGNFETYMSEWGCDDDDKAEYYRMIETKTPIEDWGITTYNGKLYYIEYWR